MHFGLCTMAAFVVKHTQLLYNVPHTHMELHMMTRTTRFKINGWQIDSTYQGDILFTRWYVNNDLCVFIKREHREYDFTYYYRASIKLLGISIMAAESTDDSPLEAFRWAREELNGVRKKLNSLRVTQHYGTRRYIRLSHDHPTASQ